MDENKYNKLIEDIVNEILDCTKIEDEDERKEELEFLVSQILSEELVRISNHFEKIDTTELLHYLLNRKKIYGSEILDYVEHDN